MDDCASVGSGSVGSVTHQAIGGDPGWGIDNTGAHAPAQDGAAGSNGTAVNFTA